MFKNIHIVKNVMKYNSYVNKYVCLITNTN